jgi:gamma-glutamylcysteine synthetase
MTITRNQVRALLDQRFIEPTRQQRPHYAGIEIELPIVNLSQGAAAGGAAMMGALRSDATVMDASQQGTSQQGVTTRSTSQQGATTRSATASPALPVDFVVIHALTEAFAKRFGFVPSAMDNHGNVYQLIDPITDDNLCYDCSYNNLEFSFGKVDDLGMVQQRLAAYLAFVQETLARSGHIVTGMGINPHRAVNRHEPLPNGRYRMLAHHLSKAGKTPTPLYFHPYPDYGMFTSASQVQIDVEFPQLIDTIRVHSLLEPLKAVLFANSPFVDAGVSYLCARDMLWEYSMNGYNPHNIGAYERIPASIDELLDYLASLSIFCAEREGRYHDFLPTPIIDYLASEKVRAEYLEHGSYHSCDIQPTLADLPHLRSYKFLDLTFRGTIEYRSCCCQPLSDALSVAAFHLGLAEADNALSELDQVLAADHVLSGHGYSHVELRRLLVRRSWPDFIDLRKLQSLLLAVMEIAHRGLYARGKGEERLLDVLFDRVDRMENPAQRALRELESGTSLETLIHEYACA